MSKPALYILMRTDLDSMNAGKAMAQSNHAYGALKKVIREALFMQPSYLEWMNQTEQEFGTTIVLGANQNEITDVIRRRDRFYNRSLVAGWVHDPTYPVRDGEMTHLIPLSTCAFVFGCEDDAKALVRLLSLHL